MTNRKQRQVLHTDMNKVLDFIIFILNFIGVPHIAIYMLPVRNIISPKMT